MFVRLFGSKYASAMKTQNSCLQFKSMAQDQSLEILIQMTKKNHNIFKIATEYQQ